MGILEFVATARAAVLAYTGFKRTSAYKKMQNALKKRREAARQRRLDKAWEKYERNPTGLRLENEKAAKPPAQNRPGGDPALGKRARAQDKAARAAAKTTQGPDRGPRLGPRWSK